MISVKTAVSMECKMAVGLMKPDPCWKGHRGSVRHQVILLILTLLPAILASGARNDHDLIVQEGENVLFDQCPLPPPSVGNFDWTYKRTDDDTYAGCLEECGTCSSAVLNISNVSRSCSGHYQYTTAPDGNGRRWTCSYQLDVYYPPSPIRIDNMQPKVFEDDDVNMTCSTEDLGNPPGNFTGQQFPKTAGTQKSTSLLLQATREHNGEVIVCEFKYRHLNRTRKNTTTVQLTVYYLPEAVSIKAPDSVTRFNVGDNVTLQCIVGRSNPNTTISWWKDDVILQGETSTIFVRTSVDVRDSGKYKCKVTIHALGQWKSKESKEFDVNVTSPGPTHVTPSSNRATKSLLTTVDFVIIGSAAVVVMVIIIVVTVLLCFWKRQDNRTQTPHHQANGSFHLVSSRPRDDVIAFGSHQGDLDVEEPQPPPYSRVDPDRRFPTTQTCPWADDAFLLPLVTHHVPSPVHVPTASFPDDTTPQAAASVPSVTQETDPKMTPTADEIEDDSSIPDKPGSLRSQPPPLPANLDINTMISSCDSDSAS